MIKKLLTLMISLYALNLTGCTSVDMAREEQLYQDSQRYDKMLGKTTPANTQYQSPYGRYEYVGKDGKPVFVTR